MKLDFGRVQSFKEKGFGFLESHFHNDNVFFSYQSGQLS